jgi:hypothetical protein
MEASIVDTRRNQPLGGPGRVVSRHRQMDERYHSRGI